MTAAAVREARKSFPLALKTADDATGSFRALVSVFGVVDDYDEILMPGAFAKSLDAIGDSAFPLMWHHKWDDMGAYVGEFTAVETEDGLEIEAQFDMEDPAGRKAYRLLKAGLIKEFSIGGFEPSGGVRLAEKDGRDVWEIHEFDLVEVSLVLRGANPETRLIDVKSAAELVAATAGPVDDDTPPEGSESDGTDEGPDDSGSFPLAQQKSAALLSILTMTTRGVGKGDS